MINKETEGESEVFQAIYSMGFYFEWIFSGDIRDIALFQSSTSVFIYKRKIYE